MEDSPIRVRIAPSPTGLLHIGTARAALFNWLFARKYGGAFVLRSEDTDRQRSLPEFEQDILNGLLWLGITWDEGPMPDGSEKGSYGPYRQSQRLAIYQKYIDKMLAENKAYYCYCTQEELEAERKAQEEQGLPIRYSGKCAHLDAAPKGRLPQVIRMRTPLEKVSFKDLVRGTVEFDLSLFGDLVIAKSREEVLYNFAVVVDDYEMKISHVIRGEDHISNTPKQIALAKLLGLPSPKFAHLPLILNQDRSKLSKRTNKVSATEYRAAGYLPSAMVNFLALLGWHPSGNKEVFTVDELIHEFDISRVQKGGAVFNQEKLDWLNREHLRLLTDEQFASLAQDFAPAGTDIQTLIALAPLAKQKLKTLGGITSEFQFIFSLPRYDAQMLVWKDGSVEDTIRILRQVLEKLEAGLPLADILEYESKERGRGAVYWPVRVALTGMKVSPSPQEVAPILGNDECKKRIKYAIKILE